MVSMFAVTALADPVSATFTGGAEMFGRMHNLSYDDGVDGNDDTNPAENVRNQNFMLQYVVLFGHMSVDETTNFHFRTLMRDGYMGDTVQGVGNWGPGAADRKGQESVFDRYWVDTKLNETMTLSFGRMNEENLAGDFGGGFYLGQQNNSIDYTGGRDQIRLDYKPSETFSMFAVYNKLHEDMYDDSNVSDMDANLYVAAARIKSGDLAINPTILYVQGSPVNQGGDSFGTSLNAHINVQYGVDKATGIQVKGTVAVYKQMDDNVTAFATADTTDTGDVSEKPMLFGASVDAAYKTDTMTIGGSLAYASSDSEAGETGTAFAFGDGWAKTQIIDNGLHYFGGLGTAGMMQIALYGNVKINDKIGVDAVAAYYMNMAKANDNYNQSGQTNEGLTGARWGNYRSGNSQTIAKNDVGGNLTEDAAMWEIDASATYAVSKTTGTRLGVAYMSGSDVFQKKDSLSDFAVYANISTWW
jgi:hypothetical protein